MQINLLIVVYFRIFAFNYSINEDNYAKDYC